MAYRDGSDAGTCVVVGGRGFLGRSLVSRLLSLGNWIVRVADTTHTLQLDDSPSDSLLSDALSSGQASLVQLDVLDVSQIKKAICNAYIVFYMELSGLDTQNFYNCYMTIVQGTKNVINACRECKVRRLIYNSTADVVFDGSQDICNGDESLMCPWKFQDMMIDLKAQAEGLVMSANNIDGLLTCVLRPSNVFGPGDPWLVPFLVNLSNYGLAKFIIGGGENLSDFTYVDNVAHAQICAAEALDSRVVSVAGKAFFITNSEPMMLWEFIAHLLEGLGYQRPFIKLPTRMVQYILEIAKWMHQKLHIKIHNYTVSAHYVIQLASRTRTFNCSAAQKQIGYLPVVSLEDGIRATIESFSHLANGGSAVHCSELSGQTKVEKLLGSGKVAEVLLWRDEKKTFICFVALVFLFYWFFLCGRTFTSSAATLLLLVAVILYGYGNLPLEIFGFAIRRTPFSSFEISSTVVKDSFMATAHLWNGGVHTARSLANEAEWNEFFMVAGFLYLVKLIASHSLTVLVGIALVFMFTAFFVYEQYESEVDGIAKVIFNGAFKARRLLMRNIQAPAKSFLSVKDKK